MERAEVLGHLFIEYFVVSIPDILFTGLTIAFFYELSYTYDLQYSF